MRAISPSGDFRDLPTDFTYVLHLATFRNGGLDYDEAIRVNAEGTHLLLEHCRTAKAALIMSTAEVYKPQLDPMHVYLETDPLGDSNSLFDATYSMSKIAQEAVARSCARAYDLPVVIARMNASYGDNGGLLAYHLDWIQSGRPVMVKWDPAMYSPIHQDDIYGQTEALLARGERAGHDRELGRRRAGLRAGVVCVSRRTRGDPTRRRRQRSTRRHSRHHPRHDQTARDHGPVHRHVARRSASPRRVAWASPYQRAPPSRPAAFVVHRDILTRTCALLRRIRRCPRRRLRSSPRALSVSQCAVVAGVGGDATVARAAPASAIAAEHVEGQVVVRFADSLAPAARDATLSVGGRRSADRAGR